MAIEQGHQEFDLDRTDRLPILSGITLEGVEDDAEPMLPPVAHADSADMDSSEATGRLRAVSMDLAQNPAAGPLALGAADLIRSGSIDLPSLAESVRTVEERISRQHAEYEAISRSYERARDAETLALSRAASLERELSLLRSSFDAEQARMRELERSFAERETAALEARARAEAAELEAREHAEASILEARNKADAATHESRSKAEAVTLEARTKAEAATLEARTRAEAATLEAHTKSETAARETERFQSETRTLKDTLAARDATISQVLHTLGERDAQLDTLKQEHAKAQHSLELRGKSHGQVEEELGKFKAQASELALKLKSSEDNGAALSQKVKRGDTEINALRAELGNTRATSHSYLEVLSSREFRRGFDENLYMELDARVGTADTSQALLRAERDKAEANAANLELKIAAQSSSIEKLQANGSAQAATVAKQAHDLKQLETTKEQLSTKLAALETEKARLTKDLAERTAQLQDARAAASGDVKRLNEQLESNETRLKELTAQIALLQSEHGDRLDRLQSEHAEKMTQIQSEHAARFSKLQTEHADFTSKVHNENSELTSRLQNEHADTISRMQKEQSAQLADIQSRHALILADMSKESEEREQEMAVLMTHLKEARKPLDPILADVKRLTEELSTKTRAFDEMHAETSGLRASLERTKGALEEREFLIRRLERAESNNANVLGRIQTSMERLGSAPVVGAPVADYSEWSAELVRIDGEGEVAHSLGRRTRIGRASGCELQIDSSSVSRHHALIVAGPRETIIEDLGSTNGVIVNGRKISRAFLNDGDMVLVGEVQFRFATKKPSKGERTAIEVKPSA